jgi:hypothetical protein
MKGDDMSPTERSLKDLRKRGFVAAVVERWNSFAHIRQDLFGWMDIIAYHPEKKITLGVQTTTRANLVARKLKVLENQHAATWLAAGNKIEVHGWAKRKIKTGTGFAYELVREEVGI